MAANSMKLLMFAVVVLCSVSNVLSIKCFDCNSNDDPKCADPFDNSTVPITNCKQEKDSRPSMCRKIRQKVNGEWNYVRGCAYFGEDDIQGDEHFCLMRTGTNNMYVEYCTCNTVDGCNSSVLTRPLSLTTTAFISLVAVAFKML